MASKPNPISFGLLLIFLRVTPYEQWMTPQKRVRQRPRFWDARPHELSGTRREATSDQAPGEDVVQVNDRYAGGGPPPAPEESEHAQHQTGG